MAVPRGLVYKAQAPLWQFPEGWCTKRSAFYMHQGSVVVSVKKFFQILVQNHWHTVSSHPQRAWVGEIQEAKKLTHQWMQVMQYEIRVWGFLRCRALYAGYEEWMLEDTSMKMACKRCGAWTTHIRHHKATTCPDVYVAVAWCQQRASKHLQHHGIQAGRIQMIWGGC